MALLETFLRRKTDATVGESGVVAAKATERVPFDAIYA